MKVKDIIDNKYEIREKLGERVFLAVEMKLMTPFTIKELPMDSHDVSEMLSLLEELRKVNHRLFPKIVEIMKEENSILVVMERVSGCCAAELPKEKRKPEMIINHALDLCEGLQYFSSLLCSDNINWRIDKENIFMDGGRVHLQDFSIVQEKDVQNERKAVLLYVKEMLGEQLKKLKKLNQKLETLQGEAGEKEFSDISEALERQLIEYNQGKKLHKRFTKAGAAILLLAFLGFGSWKGFSVIQSGIHQHIASASAAATPNPIEPTREPARPTTTPKSKKETPKPTIIEVTPTPEPTIPAKEKEKKEKAKTVTTSTPSEKSVVERTRTPIVQTRQPYRSGSSGSSGQSQRKRQTTVKKTPATKKPEKTQKPANMEINIEEESNMNIQIED